jgi:hypothetical protein
MRTKTRRSAGTDVIGDLHCGELRRLRQHRRSSFSGLYVATKSQSYLHYSTKRTLDGEFL